MRFAFPFAFSLLLAAASVLGCGGAMAEQGEPTVPSPSPSADPQVIRVPLDFTGDATGPTAKLAPYSPSLRLYLAAVVDQRDDPAIGVNKEGESPVSATWTGTAPPVFVASVVGRGLQDLGIQVTRDADASNRFLRLQLVRFYVVEGGLYRGEVRATVEVRDRAGQVLFSSLVTGNARQWGRSRNPDNYREVLTRASFDLVKTLVETAAFQAAIEVKEPAAVTP
jgi:hypothetical protein